MCHTQPGRRIMAFSGVGLALLIASISGCTDRSATGPTAPDVRADGARSHPTFQLSSLDDPAGATSVTAFGINAAGHIVGSYGTADRRTHGFLLAGAQRSEIDYPGAHNTDARGIGPDDEIVGQFSLAGEPAAVARHGYRLTSGGAYQAVHFPGHLYEILQRVLPDGTILGCRHDHDMMGSMKGIMISRADSTQIGAYASMNNGATPDRSRVVGLFTDSATNILQGYIIENGVFKPLLPAGATGAAAWDINPRGDVVGQFSNATGVHGFVLTASGYTTIDFPGATATRVYGINAAGNIVGAYVAGGRSHGFVGIRTS